MGSGLAGLSPSRRLSSLVRSVTRALPLPAIRSAAPGCELRLLDEQVADGTVTEVFALAFTPGAAHSWPAQRGLTHHLVVTGGRIRIEHDGEPAVVDLSADESYTWPAATAARCTAQGEGPASGVLVSRRQ